MPQSAFIVRPFGRKPFVHPANMAEQINEVLEHQRHSARANGTDVVLRACGSASNQLLIDFDAIEKVLIKPALVAARIRGDTTGAVVEAGNIREDMFHRLITADLVIADVSLHNPNVYYELGLRQAFRDKFTFVIRCNLDAYPFDLQTDRYFDYQLLDLVRAPGEVAARLTAALRKTLNQYRPDSPVFRLMPQLEAEDRSRFLAVPEDFREEVERAWRQRQREMLDLLALECEDQMWEIEGLRVVGRAQFEANFIDGAKGTWQRIAARYPDDAEANTVLSTVYQRLQDRTRSEQALARVTRSRMLSPSRLSELRALNGRNLKAAWVDQWRQLPAQDRRRAALRSPLLQRAIDAYIDAFKLDLNNSYAGLNALTILVIQTELIDSLPGEWRALQRNPGDEQREFEQRAERIDQLAQALLLALESDRDRLANRGQGDPWFATLEAAVMCTVSSQPDYVAQLYIEARYYAPPKSDESMMAALQIYKDLDIRGKFENGRGPRLLGTLGENVDRAMAALQDALGKVDDAGQPSRLLVFVGLRADEAGRSTGSTGAASHAADEVSANEPDAVFPASLEREALRYIEAEVDKALEAGSNLLAMAGGACGGDILFHEVCRKRNIPAQMFLALTKPQHIGEYVAPAGGEWVARFNEIHRRLSQPGDSTRPFQSGVKVFSDSPDLPRWLQDRERYNVGRRNMLWMLKHASSLTRSCSGGVEITLLTLMAHPLHAADSPGAFGGIRHAIRLAQTHGVNVRQINLAKPLVGEAADAPATAQLPAHHDASSLPKVDAVVQADAKCAADSPRARADSASMPRRSGSAR